MRDVGSGFVYLRGYTITVYLNNIVGESAENKRKDARGKLAGIHRGGELAYRFK
jgi:hypothetical protein